MFKHINKVVRTLVIADFFYNSAFASFGPVFAIFIVNGVAHGSAKVVGFSVAFYWIVKSLAQLPIARFLDKTDGERDDFWAMFFGYFLSSFVPVAYLFAKESWHLYLIQAFHGFVMAWAVPGWYSIFTRHVDKWRISFEWSLESVFSVGLAAAGAAALGGLIVDKFGFEVLFIGASIFSLTASLLLLILRKHLFSSHISRERVIPERPFPIS